MTTFKVELYVELEAEDITVDGIVAKDQLETVLGRAGKYDELSLLQDFKISTTQKVGQIDGAEFRD